jgi:hypothetical protein
MVLNSASSEVSFIYYGHLIIYTLQFMGHVFMSTKEHEKDNEDF